MTTDDEDEFLNSLEYPAPEGNAADDFNTSSWRWFLRHQGKFTALIERESPRGAAVLIRGYLESALEELLLLRALNDFTVRMQVGRALSGQLERKIATCKDLGLLSPQTCGDADMIREIGNQFAHRPEVANFDDDSLVAFFKRLRASVALNPYPDFDPEDPPRGLGTILSGTMVHLFGEISERIGKESERWTKTDSASA